MDSFAILTTRQRNEDGKNGKDKVMQISGNKEISKKSSTSTCMMTDINGNIRTIYMSVILNKTFWPRRQFNSC